MAMSKKCSVDNCDNEAFYKRSGLCNNCYQSLYWWSKRGPTRVMERKRQLKVFADRMEALVPSSAGRRRR